MDAALRRGGQPAARSRRRECEGSALAEAGGGVYVEGECLVDGSAPPTSKEKREAKKRGGGVAGEATQQIVEHILVLSFGERFKVEMKEFVRIFYAYKRAGMIK